MSAVNIVISQNNLPGLMSGEILIEAGCVYRDGIHLTMPRFEAGSAGRLTGRVCEGKRSGAARFLFG